MNSNNSKNNNIHQHNGMHHGLWMMICCLLPILLIAALPLLGIKAAWLGTLAALACPLGMVMMMFNMGNKGEKNNNGCHSDKKEELQANKE